MLMQDMTDVLPKLFVHGFLPENRLPWAVDVSCVLGCEVMVTGGELALPPQCALSSASMQAGDGG